MTKKDLALHVLQGKETDVIPFFPDISDWYKVKRLPRELVHQIPTGSFIPDHVSFHQHDFGMPQEFKQWTYLDFYRNFNWGLHVHIYDWLDMNYLNCNYTVARNKDQLIKTFDTPIGSIQHIDAISTDGSCSPIEHYVKNMDDWKVVEYIIKNCEPIAKYDYVNTILAGIGDLGIADLVIWRSPFGKIVQEYAGFENTVYHLMDKPEVIHEILQLQTVKDVEVIQLAAESDADLVIISDHADEQILNPTWYETYCLPFYDKAIRLLHAKGKYVSTHLDGNFKGLFNLVKRSGFDLLDGCTPAPMTNYEIEELPLSMTPHMKVYCGVPSAFFVAETPLDTIFTYAERIVNTLKERLILNVGDILPSNGDIFKVIEMGKWVSKHHP